MARAVAARMRADERAVGETPEREKAPRCVCSLLCGFLGVRSLRQTDPLVRLSLRFMGFRCPKQDRRYAASVCLMLTALSLHAIQQPRLWKVVEVPLHRAEVSTRLTFWKHSHALDCGRFEVTVAHRSESPATCSCQPPRRSCSSCRKGEAQRQSVVGPGRANEGR
eukprot:6212709-Pleurochrysis_carterae.AAC.6